MMVQAPITPPKPEDAAYFFNRELSWIRFNQRVLEEAQDETHPLLERLKFLSIFSGNLDEFFMVRVAGLKEQTNAGIYEPTPDGLTPAEQLRKIAKMLHPLVEQQSKLLLQDILPNLALHNVRLVSYAQLSDARKQHLRTYFREKIFPILTPLAIDPAHPFPKLRGLALNLLVELRSPAASGRGKAEKRIAVVPVPSLLPRFYFFPEKPLHEVVLMEELIEAHLDMLFPNLKITELSFFRVTRNADLDISEAEADDLLKLVERELRKRRLGTVIRLEVNDRMPKESREYLKDAFALEEQDIYRIKGHLGLESFMQLMEVDCKELKDEPFIPAMNPLLARSKTIFDAMREQDILLHHPYDSFQPVVRLVQEAARDPNVLAIKQTLYRSGGRSSIVEALKEAALNGKQVTTLIELQARFDEETNITWARELERAGVNVVYGLLGLKIHSKVLLVVRQEGDRLRYYSHLSTGNYNERTAQVYTDFGLLTTNQEIGEDLSEIFNLLTGYSQQKEWRRLFIAPINMRQHLLAEVEACIRNHTPEQPSCMRLMMNSLVDMEMISALYDASRAGVEVDLIVRGICCLVPGVPGVSEHIRVRSIVGRFLEHLRVFSFAYADQEHIFSGSADWMPRNLNRRIEVVYPITYQPIKQQVQDILNVMLQDNMKARLLLPDGTYSKPPAVTGRDEEFTVAAQDVFLQRSRQQQRAMDTTVQL